MSLAQLSLGIVVLSLFAPHATTQVVLDPPVDVGLVGQNPELLTPSTGRVVINHTYAPGSPFLDLGEPLAGTTGNPIQLADGTLVGGEGFSLRLVNALPGAPAGYFAGLSQADSPHMGGVIVPSLDFILAPLLVDGGGQIGIEGLWPTDITGVDIYLQFWMLDPGGVFGWSSTTGVRASVP